MKYYELTVETTAEFEDILTDILICNGSEGVEVKNSAEIASFIESRYNFDYYEESILNVDSCVLVRGFFSSREELNAAKAEIAESKENAFFQTGSLNCTTREFDDSEYQNTWKQYYKPIAFKDIVIVPEWMEAEGEKKLFLDPGCAFGTGSHHTTAMCIEELCEIPVKKKLVADIGCGSGILALSALTLGAKQAVLFDIDEDALGNARKNAELNGLTKKCEFVSGDLFGTHSGTFDIIFANIVADVLIKLAPMLAARLNEGGLVIMSGILDVRLPEVVAACEVNGLSVVNTRSSGDWSMIVVRVA